MARLANEYPTIIKTIFAWAIFANGIIIISISICYIASSTVVVGITSYAC